MMRIMIIMSIVFVYTYGDEDRIDGKKLFDDAKCMACHTVSDFNDKTIRKSKTFAQMKNKVSTCQIKNDVHWFDDEEEAVAKYLNQEFYHFKEKE